MPSGSAACRVEVYDFIPLFVDFRTDTTESTTKATLTMEPTEVIVKPATNTKVVSICDDTKKSTFHCDCRRCAYIPELERKTFTVEGACISFLNGTYEGDCTLKGQSFYRHIDDTDVTVVIRKCDDVHLPLEHTNNYTHIFPLKPVPSNEMKYWYITALFEKGVNVNYYYVPINKSCCLVPPSTGWKHVGVHTAIADVPPLIVTQIDDAPAKEFIVHGASTQFLNGIYHEVVVSGPSGPPGYMHSETETSGADCIYIHQEVKDNMKYWYISAAFEHDVTVHYYSAPITNSCVSLPPSTGWTCIGTDNSVADDESPRIYHLIE